jgi:OLD-like protein
MDVPGAVVVVEGASDRAALEALAERRELDLDAAGVEIAVLGGAHRIGRFVKDRDDDGRLIGLCDAGEEPVFRRALERTRSTDLFVCHADLEDELIRALGAPAIEEILGANDDLHRFRTLQQMPAWRGRATEQQLRRFMGSGGRRKMRYARILVDALAPDRVPAPLDAVLTRACGGTPPVL